MKVHAHLLQCLCHNLRSVVDSEHNVGHTSSGKSLNLMENHGLVSELDQRLRESKGLVIVSWCALQVMSSPPLCI